MAEKHSVVLRDGDYDSLCEPSDLTATVSLRTSGIEIGAEGYGENAAENGYGTPVVIEYWEGELRCLVWSDINDPNPTHVISLEGARESNRKEN